MDGEIQFLFTYFCQKCQGGLLWSGLESKSRVEDKGYFACGNVNVLVEESGAFVSIGDVHSVQNERGGSV